MHVQEVDGEQKEEKEARWQMFMSFRTRSVALSRVG